MYEKKLAGSDDGDAMKKDKIKEVSVHACLCLCVCVSDSADCAEVSLFVLVPSGHG